MTDSKPYMKWFYRALLILLSWSMGCVVLQREYNFAHWVPHTFLRELGMSYPTLLFLESNADKALHPLGAFLLMLSLLGARLPSLSEPKVRAAVLMSLAIVVAELLQWQIGRGFDVIDLVLGILGIYAAGKLFGDCYP